MSKLTWSLRSYELLVALELTLSKGDGGRVVFFGGLRFQYRRIPFVDVSMFETTVLTLARS